MAQINWLILHFYIIWADNKIGVEGAKALGEMLKLNINLATLNMGKFMQLYAQIRNVVQSLKTSRVSFP